MCAGGGTRTHTGNRVSQRTSKGKGACDPAPKMSERELQGSAYYRAMVKLNQIVAIEKGERSASLKVMTEVHHKLKDALLSGLRRTYQPKDDEGEALPGESTNVQATVQAALVDVRTSVSEYLNVMATRDFGNCELAARADVKVGDQVIVAQAPVSFLLSLEKELVSLHTLVSSLPVLDAATQWTFDDQNGFFRSEPVQTTRTKKVPKAFVKAEATEKHPAQVEMFTEDVIVGTWTNVRLSGAIPDTTRRELLAKVVELQKAVKFAREQANGAEVERLKVGDSVMTYLLG